MWSSLVLLNILEIVPIHHASCDLIGSHRGESQSQSHDKMLDVYVSFPVYLTTLHSHHLRKKRRPIDF